MGVLDRVKQQARQLTGRTKEALGRAVGNEELENAGKRDRLAGHAREAAQDVKDKAAGAAEDARKRVHEGREERETREEGENRDER